MINQCHLYEISFDTESIERIMKKSKERKVIKAIVAPEGALHISLQADGHNDLIRLQLYYSSDMSRFSAIDPDFVYVTWPYDKSVFERVKKIATPYSTISLSVSDSAFENKSNHVYEDDYSFDIKSVDDRQLALLSEELQQKIIFASKDYGEFIYDREFHLYEIETKWFENKVTLQLSFNDEDTSLDKKTIEKALKNAKKIFDDKEVVWKKIKEQIINQKYDIIWDEPEAGISKEDFANNIMSTIGIINVTDYDYVEFWFDDGGFFGGHSILASSKISEYIFDIGLEG